MNLCLNLKLITINTVMKNLIFSMPIFIIFKNKYIQLELYYDKYLYTEF